MAPFTKNPTVEMHTSEGVITLELFADKAPKAVENMVRLSEKNYYDGSKFHRVIKEFMIQGGKGPASEGEGNSIWGKPFKDEFTADLVFDKEGLLAMANCGPNTNGSQFFITTVETPWLNHKHTIFGKVISGYDIVKKIEGVKTSMHDSPLNDVVIKKMVVKR